MKARRSHLWTRSSALDLDSIYTCVCLWSSYFEFEYQVSPETITMDKVVRRIHVGLHAKIQSRSGLKLTIVLRIRSAVERAIVYSALGRHGTHRPRLGSAVAGQ
jgi:hypothetical protein